MKAFRPALLLLTGALVTATVTGSAQTGTAQRARPPRTNNAPKSAAVVRPAVSPAFKVAFERDVQPILQDICASCHDAEHAAAAGGLDAEVYADPASLISRRDGWEKVLARLRAAEMPPPTAQQPSEEELNAFIATIQTELDRIDRITPPDPGRVTAHRLNRAEYANTIRDLLGVDFRATDEFPADDSGYGFDNIGDVLTVSPALMQKYLSAAERIAARAVGGDPLPSPGVFTRRDRVRRLSDNVIELEDIAEYDAEYVVKVGVTGHRGATDKPVTLQISVDGKPVKTVDVPVQISAVNRQGGSTQRSLVEARVWLPGNRHVFRASFLNDEALKTIPVKSRRDVNLNIFPEYIEIAGPFPAAEHHVVPRRALVCNPAAGPACVNRILTTLARRAYRRPATRAEITQLVATFNKARAADYSPAHSLQFAIASMLISPQFLFRIERDPRPGIVARITDFELASRLSYFLWSSMPDDQLLALAEANRLHLPAVLDAQVKRMIADPKSAAFAENFAGQWLETRSLDAIERDAQKFPEWNRDLRDAMRTETRLFFETILKENRPITEFIDGKYTFLNERLARHYAIDGVEGPDFRRVALTTAERGGVFTQASVLTVSSYPTRTSVVLRGKFLLENVLNAPPPAPPPGVPALDEASVGVAKSLRTQMEQHRADPLCASCHNRMDPLGFALENYDAIGRWRTEDGKFHIDPSGMLPNGTAFATPAELKALLVGNAPEFARGLSEKMLTYALGRGVESYDRVAIKGIVQHAAARGYRMQALIQGIVKSTPFQRRRANREAVVEARR
jgi:hypothetical protein